MCYSFFPAFQAENGTKLWSCKSNYEGLDFFIPWEMFTQQGAGRVWDFGAYLITKLGKGSVSFICTSCILRFINYENKNVRKCHTSLEKPIIIRHIIVLQVYHKKQPNIFNRSRGTVPMIFALPKGLFNSFMGFIRIRFEL